MRWGALFLATLAACASSRKAAPPKISVSVETPEGPAWLIPVIRKYGVKEFVVVAAGRETPRPVSASDAEMRDYLSGGDWFYLRLSDAEVRFHPGRATITADGPERVKQLLPPLGLERYHPVWSAVLGEGELLDPYVRYIVSIGGNSARLQLVRLSGDTLVESGAELLGPSDLDASKIRAREKDGRLIGSIDCKIGALIITYLRPGRVMLESDDEDQLMVAIRQWQEMQ